MAAKIINGKALSDIVRARAAARAQALAETFRAPSLAVILVGDDPASRVYVNNKKKACAACGITSLEYLLPADTTQDEVLELIAKLNADAGVDGILCQLPLPAQIDKRAVINAILPDKDVDGFTPYNVGRMLSDEDGFLPCTPAGVIELLKFGGVEICGKHCVVIGRSRIVGKPAAVLMLRENATVTVCHSRTTDLASHPKTADIMIAAVGIPNFVTADMVKSGAAVIDVGIHRGADGRLCGDVDFAAVSEVAGAITPVPGGVGPMTIAMLMQNTVRAAEIHKK